MPQISGINKQIFVAKSDSAGVLHTESLIGWSENLMLVGQMSPSKWNTYTKLEVCGQRI